MEWNMSYIHNFGDPIWFSCFPILRVASAKQYNIILPNVVPGIELGVNIGSAAVNVPTTPYALMHFLYN
jgi:hypothetical protein